MKGIVYTLAIYLILIIIFEIFVFSLQQQQLLFEKKSHLNYQKEFLQHVDHIAQILKKELKITVNSYRNESSIFLFVSDTGFPLEQISNYQFNFSSLLDFLNYYQNLKNYKAELNLTKLNQSGLKLVTNLDINYSQNNSNPLYDELKIKLSPNIDLRKIKIEINCSSPPNASAISYINWQQTGTNILSNISFFDQTRQHNNVVYFSLSNQNNFSATYLDSSSYKIYAVHLDYIPSNYEIRFWSDPNTTYFTPYTKQNISCNFKFETELNSNSYNEIYAYIPALLSLNYKDINYSGYLFLFRK